MSTARIEPVQATENRAPAVHAHVRRLAGTLESAAARLRDGRDPEAVHDIRVAARRLTSTLSLWDASLDPMSSRRARRGLRRLRRRLSRTREREVLAQQLAELIVGEPLPLREAGMIELERLARRGAASRAAAARRVRRSQIARLVRRIESCLAAFVGASERALADARAHADARKERALAALAACAEGDDDALHRARVAVKTWRYEIECLLAASDDPRGAALPLLRELQQSLGAIHDAAVLRDFIFRRAWRVRAQGRLDRSEALASLSEKAARARWRALERLPAVVARVGAPHRA